MNTSLVLIAHRGNTEGREISKENSPLYIDNAISRGFDVEIDLRFIKEELFLGHDLPQYKIDFNWLNQRKAHLWIHCKNFESINFLSRIDNQLNFFFHESDDFVLTSKGYLWTAPGKKTSSKSIAVMPELIDINWLEKINNTSSHPFGYCSDFVGKLLEK